MGESPGAARRAAAAEVAQAAGWPRGMHRFG
jgi:hypothetical protein